MRAKNAVVNIGTDSRGNYRADIGFETKANGTIGAHKFYFGMDRSSAAIRYLNARACWDAVQKRSFPARPLWNRLTVAIARAVSSGLQDFGIDPTEYIPRLRLVQSMPSGESRPAEVWEALRDVDPSTLPEAEAKAYTSMMELSTKHLPITGESILSWLTELQADFPMIRLHLEGELAGTVVGAVKASASTYRKLAADRGCDRVIPQDQAATGTCRRA